MPEESDRADTLQKLIEEAANDVHGGCQLYYDGDNFQPPPWVCVLTWWCGMRVKGEGDTPEEAINQAIAKKKKLRPEDGPFERATWDELHGILEEQGEKLKEQIADDDELTAEQLAENHKRLAEQGFPFATEEDMKGI